ncbi:MAG: glutathione binding-like protein [Rhodopila sp.]
MHRLCLSATPAPEGGGAGEKRWRPADRRRSHRCLRSAAPSSPSCSLRLRFLIVARTATGGFFNTLPKCQSSVNVLEKKLNEVPYLATDYSIADVAAFAWVKFAFPTIRKHLGEQLGLTPGIDRWLKTISARPAVSRGLRAPKIRLHRSVPSSE